MKSTSNTVLDIILFFKKELAEIYDASELQQAIEITLFYYLGLTKVDLIVNSQQQIPLEKYLKLVGVVDELKKEKPLAYIIGEWEFFGLLFRVTESTLIPRQETEELVQLILNENKGEANVLDIGTGTGCIPISLKKRKNSLSISACDLSKEALRVAEENAELNKVTINFFQLDIIDSKRKALTEKLDVIVSNPPYIPNQEKALMSKNVLDYEPGLALFVKDDEPLLFYDAIGDFALTNLKNKGKLYFEINEHYGAEVKELLTGKGFKNVNIVKDINNKDRIISCCK